MLDCRRKLGNGRRLLELRDGPEHLAHEDRSRRVFDEERWGRRRNEGDALRLEQVMTGDADALIERLRDARTAVVIPPKSNRKEKRECDFILYKERNLIERLVEKLKQFRAIATRYDKLARNFLGAIRLVAAVIQLN